MRHWRLTNDASHEEQARFPSLAAVFALDGQQITSDPLSQVLRVRIGPRTYYLKRYSGAGKRIRRWLGRPRVKAEWQNLRLFATWGIPTAELVGWGLQRWFSGRFRRGALITREIPGAVDLAKLWENHDARLHDPAWVARVSRQLAGITRTLHSHRFAHNDLKWRNILVDARAKVYLIDCPSGTFWRGPVLRRRIIKDLACLDKIGKQALSRSQRLRFYLHYRDQPRLKADDHQMLRDISTYFEGRE